MEQIDLSEILEDLKKAFQINSDDEVGLFLLVGIPDQNSTGVQTIIAGTNLEENTLIGILVGHLETLTSSEAPATGSETIQH